jgi:hypothetical protein
MENFVAVARRWYEKAVDSDDSFDQFISIWISFNAIYGRREGKEFRKIKSIINEFNRETITKILSFEEVQFFCRIDPPIEFLNMDLEVEDTSSAQMKLKRNLERQPRFALENLMFILNKVRNNLFHGDKRIERARDVDIVRHAYPIVKEIVKSHLGLDEQRGSIGGGSNPSIERELSERVDFLQEEMANILENYSVIPKGAHHPISILLDRNNMQANGIEPGWTTPQQLKDIRNNILDLYERNKPEVLRDIEEVYNFVDKRMQDVIDNGCKDEDLESFMREYTELQRKYLDKGYRFKF